MIDIYISTAAFHRKSIDEVIQIAQKENFALEFSSGIPYRKDIESVYLKAEIRKMPHNYFPAPENPFVLNLGSANEEIRERSIAHCIKGLYLAKVVAAPFFAAHAGFCMDPDPKQLGRKISYDPDFDVEEHTRIFIQSLHAVLKKAVEYDIDFLIENNVIAAFNLVNGKINPSLCCESGEISKIIDAVANPRLGLLLDTAHLKVSCQTLGLDKDKELTNLQSYIKGIHHSDNDGLTDSNQPLSVNYWYLPHAHSYSDLPHVIEVQNIDIDKIKEQTKLLENNGC